jgi:hypothetical protein
VRGEDRDFARDIAETTRMLAERNPNVATVTGVAVYVDGLVRCDPTTLRRAVGMLRASPRVIVRAEALTGLGTAELEIGRKAAGVAALDEAWDAFHRMGAHGETLRVQREEKTRIGILSTFTLRTAAKLAPIGYPDRYSIEQTPSDRVAFCSKTGFDSKAPVTCDRSSLGWEHIISF